MYKKILFKCMLVLAILPCSVVVAKEQTPIETFISQVRTTNKFVEVSNLWSTDRNFDMTSTLTKVEKAEPLVISYDNVAGFMDSKTMAISLVVPAIGGGTYTIDMARYDFFSNDFQLHVKGANNSDGVFDYKPGLYYRGVVKGIPGSVAAFSFFNNEVYGVFSIPGEGNYALVPNTMVGNYYDYNQHYLLYNDKDIINKDDAPQCATDALPKDGIEDMDAMTTTLNNNVYNSCTEVRVYEVGDYAMYLTKGKSVSKVANFLTALFNNQSTIYRNEGIPIVLKYMEVDSVTDSYQKITTAKSSLFLTEFGNVTRNNMHGCDVAILASTALNGGYGAMGGVAWLRAMCSKYISSNKFGPYGFVNLDNAVTSPKFPLYTWNVEVMSHEMGHIVGSPHTHACCWNPPGTGKTAIDGCYTLEGSCAMPVPQYPKDAGTIMSYCHLTSTGINFSNGFGQQPGDTIRWYINKKFSASCGAVYAPTAIPLSVANKTLNANRECTDMTSGLTYYWYDNNTADHADDTLVLMIKKNGNNIGNLNTTGFSISSRTLTGYGGGAGTFASFKPGTPGIGGYSVAMRRYWNIETPTEPTSEVEVMFPFTKADTSDVSGTAKVKPTLSGYKFYKAITTINPNPAADSLKYASTGISFYTFGAAASATNWAFSTISDYSVASMKMSTLSGGGTGFFSYGPVSVANVNAANGGVYVYPNPTSDKWFVALAKTNGQSAVFQLYTVDGKMVHTQVLSSDNINTVEAVSLTPGVYFYRIISESNVYTGNVMKQ